MTLLEATRIVSFGLVVLIWLVQLVIYPAFGEIERDRFLRWHAGYTRSVTWVVAPLMFGQVFLLGWLLVVRPSPPAIVAAALVAIAWVSTFALAVPAHGRLGATGQDETEIRRLIANNWIRTVSWTLAFAALLFA
ncbi:hypothetical protein EP7_001783 [Isosphaeraceae bacterium EP7]